MKNSNNVYKHLTGACQFLNSPLSLRTITFPTNVMSSEGSFTLIAFQNHNVNRGIDQRCHGVELLRVERGPLQENTGPSRLKYGTVGVCVVDTNDS